MKMIKLAIVAAAAGAAVPAGAVITTFATFGAVNSDSNLSWKNSGTSVSRTSDAVISTGHFVTTVVAGKKTKKFVLGATDVKFTFLQAPLASYVTDVVAAFTLNATIAKGTPASWSGAGFTQPGLKGSFSFLTTSAISVGVPSFVPHVYPLGSNLLSGTFNPATVSGSGTGGSGSASNQSAMTTITFTSDFLDFTPTVQRDLAFALTAILPSLGKDSNGALKSFRAVIGGQFSSDPAPVINGLAIVPEPASWALMVGGFGLVGFAARRRSRVAVA